MLSALHLFALLRYKAADVFIGMLCVCVCVCARWGVGSGFLLDKEMLMGQCRVIEATSKRALSVLLISRAELRSKRCE